MGLAFNGKCFDTGAALAADALKMSGFESTGMYFVKSASVTGTTLSYSVEHRNSANTTTYIRTSTVPLASCNTQFSDMPLEGILFIVALFIAAVAGMSNGRAFAS